MICTIDNCELLAKSRGFCHKHYQRWWKTGDPLGIRPARWDNYKRPDCLLTTCHVKAHAHGLCISHLKRLERHGDPLGGGKFHSSLDPIEHLLSLVVIEPNGCWSYTAGKTTAGYGEFQLDGITQYAHRVSYQFFNGEIPEGLTIDHTCHNIDASCPGGACTHRACINPAHLEAVTQEENLRRAKYRVVGL